MSTALASPALEQAAEWFALREQGWTDDEQHRWRAWLHADAGHADAWRQVESVWQSFAPLSAPAAATALDAAGLAAGRRCAASAVPLASARLVAGPARPAAATRPADAAHRRRTHRALEAD
jgi:ferric-dicitrate binding protein FerR (iron transport regulator)